MTGNAHDADGPSVRPPQSVETPGADGQRRPRRRRVWILATALVVALLTVGGVAVIQLGWPGSTTAGDHHRLFRSEDGSQPYQVHLPPQHGDGPSMPVVMAIHGCGMTGFGANSMRAATQLDALADREGFIVVYPTQRLFRNVINCWSSSDPRHQHRYTGEPALLAGVARQVVADYEGDPARVHVTGASSGAGTAVILAATYPEVFATVTSVAGGEYALNQVDPAATEETPPQETARQAWSQMGERARRVPLLVVQGEQDDVVVPAVATRLVEHWTAVDDLVDDGLLNDSLELSAQTATTPAQDGRHGYTHTVLAAPDGASVVESYLVQDMGHVWPGPTGEGQFTDQAGPDASAIVWEFARRHPCLDCGGG